jgi:hypothetical protein
MPLLRGNLHAHTTFSDGVRSPAALVAEYESRGYDFLAITDHEDHANWVEPGYQQALDRLRPGLLLFRGIEVNFDPIAQHVGKVIGDTETLWILNHPARYRLSVDETRERITRIQAAGWPLAAIEVTDTGHYRPEYDTEAIPLVKIATDDAHRTPHFGRAWIEVDAPRDRDAIIRAIRAGEVQIRFSDR